MKRSLIMITVFVLSFYSKAQKVNPDANNIQVKNNSEVIYKSTNSSEDLKSVKSVIDSRGLHYVLFCDGNMGTAYLASNPGGNWKTEVLSNTESESYTNGEGTRYLAMDIDKNDGLHVMLVGYPGTIYYGYRQAGGSWNFTEISKDKMPWLHNFYIFQEYIDMIVDANSGVHAVARADIDSKGHSSIYFYKPQSGKWQTEIIREGISNTEKDFGNEPSIAIKGKKVVASIGGDWSLSYVEKTIGSKGWNIDELLKDDKSKEAKKMNTSLVLNSNSTPVISFREYASGDYRGVNILTRNKCSGKWNQEAIGDGSSSGSAIAGNNGVLFLAYCNDGGYTKVAYQTCNCEQTWKTVYDVNDESKIFMDMLVDSKKHTHLYYSTYNDEIKHVDLWFDGDPNFECNYRPTLYFKGKTNVKPGEEWSGKIYASDPECDPVEIYSIILNKGFELKDHGNGSATIKGKIPIGKPGESGEVELLALCNDDKHPEPNGPQSKIIIKLKITPEGTEKGSVKHENNCTPKKKKVIESDLATEKVEGISEASSGSNKDTNYESGANSDKIKDANSKNNTAVSNTCKDYLDRYEAWANKYIPLKKKVNENPTDMNAVMKIATMSAEIGNWAIEWANLHECSQDEGFQTRYNKITDRIHEVNK